MQEDPETIVLSQKVSELRPEIGDLFEITSGQLNDPQPGYFKFRGRFHDEIPVVFDELRRRFEKHGFTPLVREDNAKMMGQVALVGMPTVFERPKSNWQVNLMLFLATILTTLFAGSVMSAETEEQLFQIWRGWPYSFSVLLILGAHELGHYFAARYHNSHASLPYFIPFPSALIGTMGAVIFLREPLKNKRALFDMGAAGPLAGLVFALPILIIGIATATVEQLPPGGGYYLEGNSLLYLGLKFLIHGQVLPSNGMDMVLNQLSWAGWTGLFVTGLNLIPVGQLDGGHVSYVLFGKRAKLFFWPVIAFLGVLALLFSATTFQWLLWIGLLFFLGRRHAEPLDDVTPLDPRRRALAIFTLCLFFFVFVPIPITLVP